MAATTLARVLSRDLRSGVAGVVVAAPALAAVVFWRGAFNVFHGPKLAVVVLAAAVALALGIMVATRDGTFPFTPSPWTWAALAVLVIALAATLTAPAPVASFFGARGRYSGSLLYLSLGVLGLAAAWTATVERARWLLHALLAAATVVAGYGVYEEVTGSGLSGTVSGVHSTLGNPNFVGGWIGAVTGVIVWHLLDRRVSIAVKAWAAVVLVAAVFTEWATGAFQGWPTAGTAVVVFGGAWLWGRPARVRRSGFAAIAVVAVAGTAVVVLGIVGAGPLARLSAERGIELRRHYWRAAVVMAVDEPLLGVGFDRFDQTYRTARTPAAADTVDLALESDAAHSVPLQLLSGGGFPLGLAYVGLIAAGGWAAVRAIARAQHDHARLVVGAVASVWMGYHVQSLVSFDVPGLAVLHWVAAGTLAGLAWPRAVRAVGSHAGVPTGVRAGGRTTGGSVQRRAPVALWRWVTGVVALLFVAMLGVMVATWPIRAEVAAGNAILATTRGQVAAARMSWESASAIGSWEAEYPYRLARLALRAGNGDYALDALADAHRREAGHFGAALTAARVAMELDRVDEATEWYERALAMEPHHVDLKLEAASFFLEHGDRDLASALVAEVLEDQPGNRAARTLHRRLRRDA